MSLLRAPLWLMRRAASSRLTMDAAVGLLLLIAALLAGWVAFPEVIGNLPAIGPLIDAVGNALVGPRPSSYGTLLVFEIAAGYGFFGFVVCLEHLANERRAIAEAGGRIGVLKNQPEIVESDLSAGFFSGGALAMADVERTATYAMLENIRKDAIGYRYEPIALIVERVVPAVTSGSQRVRDAQTLGLRLGILGTFVGMSLALVDVTQIFSATADVGTSQNAIHAIIGKLSLAFGTSIAGLVAAILLQIVLGGLLAREDRTLTDLQELAADAQAVCRRCEIRSSIAREMRDLQETVRGHRQDIESQAERVSREVERLADFAGSASVAFAAPLESLERSGRALGVLVDGQRQAAATLAEGLRASTDAETRLGAAFEAAIARAGAAQGEALSGLADVMASHMTEVIARIEAGFRTDDRFAATERIEQALTAAIERLDRVSGRQERLIRLFGRLGLAMVGFTALIALAMVGVALWWSVLPAVGGTP